MAVVTPVRSSEVTAISQAYAATSALKLVSAGKGNDIHVCYAQLTGAMTINLTFTDIAQFQRVFIHLTADTTARAVTFGTGFIQKSAPQMRGSVLTVPVSSNATVECVYDGAALRIVSVTCEGKGETIESPAYAAAIEVTDQSAKMHIITPGQLTGALQVDATAVTKHAVGDLFIFHFSTDGTQRIVTFNTNFLASGTVTIPASKTATAWGFFNGTKICIVSREISA